MIKAKIKFVFLIIFFLTLGTQLAHSQQGNIFTNFDETVTRADAYFDDYAFLSAIDLYKEVLEKEPENGYAKIKIARAYKKLNNYQEAEKWFRAAIEDNEYAQPLDQLYFAQVLMTNGKHQKAKKWLVQYTRTQKDIRAINNLVGIEQMESFYEDSALYNLKGLIINSEGNDFSPVFDDSLLIFLSNREKATPIKYVNSWSQNNFYDVYQSDLSDEGNPSKPKLVNKAINSKYHEGPLSLYDGGNKMIFTRSLQEKTAKGERLLGLFTAERESKDKSWQNIQPFPFNHKEYSVFHPAMSEDGDTLYFSSEMTGGYGGADIYRSVMENGSWTKPENMGSQLNTEGNELFPYLHKQVLYFSSDGHAGLGGLDIYQVELYKNGQLQVENIGYPLNSSYDDFSLAWRGENKGALTSNRPNGYGNDDIYLFQNKLFTNKELIALNGIVVDKNKQSPVEGASIYIIDEETGIDFSIGSEKKGKFTFQAIKDHNYTILAENAGRSGILSMKAVDGLKDVTKIEIWRLPTSVEIEVDVRDEASGEAVKLATVKLKKNGSVISQDQTSFSGKVAFGGNSGSAYTLEVASSGYASIEKSIEIPEEGFSDTLKVAVVLEKLQSKTVELNGLVVDVVKFTELPDATVFIVNAQTGEKTKLKSDKYGAFEFEGIVGNTYRTFAEFGENRTVGNDFIVEDPARGTNENILLSIKIQKRTEKINPLALKIKMNDQISRESISFGVVKLFSEDTIRLLDYTNPNGELVINVEKGKEFQIKSDVLGYKEAVLNASTKGDLLSDTIELAFLLEKLELKIIRGLATDNISGNGVAATKIYLINETTKEEKVIVANSNGEFSFRGKEGEVFSILAEKDQKKGTIKQVTITERHFGLPINIKLFDKSKFAYVAVKVADKKSGKAVPLAQVLLQRNEVPELMVKTDISGTANLKVKREFNYVLEISHVGYKNQTLSLEEFKNNDDSINLNVYLEKQLPGQITMKGSMYLNGAKMQSEGATVFIVNEKTGESKIQLTDKRGDFQFGGRAGEVYDIVGDDEEFSGMVEDIEIKGPDAEANKRIILPVNELTKLTALSPDLRNRTLSPARISEIIIENQNKFKEITGHVFDKNTGQKVSNAFIYIINNHTGESHSLLSDAEGDFQFSGGNGQEITVLVDKDIRSGLYPYLAIDNLKDTLRLGIWGFPPPVTLQVKILDKASQKPVKLTMVALSESGNLIQQEQTQISGEVFLRTSAGGKYEIRGLEKDYEENFLALEIPADSKIGDTLKIDLLLTKRKPKLFTVIGNVVDEVTSRAVDSVTVYIMDSKTWEVETVQTGKSGMFNFKGFPGEQFQIIGEKNHEGTSLIDVTVGDKNDTIGLQIKDTHFQKRKPLNLVYLNVRLQDKETGEVIPRGMIKLSVEDTVKQTFYANTMGEKLLLVKADTEYYVEGSKIDFATAGQVLISQTQNHSDTIQVVLSLEAIKNREALVTGIAIEGNTSEILEQVQVYIRNETTGAEYETITGADGKFKFNGKIGETYTILAEGVGERGSLNNYLLRDANLTAPLQLKLYPISVPLFVKVKVKDKETEKAIALASLTLTYQDSYQQNVFSSMDGEVLFHAHSGKDYLLKITHPSYKGHELVVKSIDAKNDSIVLDVILDKDLPVILTMHGHVYDVEGNKPLSNANVYIINDRNAEVLEFKADDKGDFSFPATEGYSYTILADNNIRSGMVADLLIANPLEKANPFIKIPAYGVLEPVIVDATVIDEDTKKGIPGATVKQYAGKSHIRNFMTDLEGRLVWEEFKNEGYYLVVEKENYEMKLVPLEFGNLLSGDTITFNIAIKNAQAGAQLTADLPVERAKDNGKVDNTIFKNIRIVHNEGETPQVFLSVEQGFYAYKESNGQAVLDNGRKEILLSENWQEEKVLLQSLYEILAKKNLQVQDTISIQKLYYGFDKFHLSGTAVADLEKIAEVMTTNPEINVELKAYTDSRGPVNYNKELAKKRVSSAYQYLIKKGILPNRITQTPVGEAGAVKDCTKVPCTEADHKLNRRTEMLIRYEVD